MSSFRAFAWLLGAAVAAAGVGATRGVGSPSVAAVCGKLLPPASGIYHAGAPDFVSNPGRLEGDTVTLEAIRQLEGDAGRPTVWTEISQHWFTGLEFPRAKVTTAWRAGQIPYIRMQSHAGSPWGVGNPPEAYPGEYSLQNIIAGRFDPPLRAWAAAARDSEVPLLLEFGIEENNDWGPWAGDWNGAGDTSGYGDPAFPDGPERFRDAYRHIVTLFREQGATNVTWFFHVDTWWAPRVPWATYANYYPGDDYVDWIGLSVYGWRGAPGNAIFSFEQKLQTDHSPQYPGSYADITALSSRPIALVEVAAPVGTDEERAAWVAGMFETLASGRYPRIAALAWWNSFDIKTRLDLWPRMRDAFRAGIATPVYGATPRLAGTCTPGRPSALRARRLGASARLTWRPVANAVAYEVLQGSRVVGRTEAAQLDLRARHGAAFAVRATNVLGRGPLSARVVVR